VGPQPSTGLTTAGVPHSVVPSEQDPGIQRRYPASHKHGPHATQPSNSRPHHRAMHKEVRQGLQRCAPSSASSPAQAVAEQHTAARNSCTVPTLHHSTAVALHRSAPCSSRQPKNLVNLSSLDSRKESYACRHGGCCKGTSNIPRITQRIRGISKSIHWLATHSALPLLQHAPRDAPGQSPLQQAKQQRPALAPCGERFCCARAAAHTCC
jgi:hypothetical protein